MATLISDSFVDTNGTDLFSHTPTTDEMGWGWGQIGTDTWEINSNSVAITSTPNTWAFAVIQPGDKDVDVTINFTTPTGNSAVGIVVHWKDSDNHWRIQNQTDGDSLRIADIIGGTFTQRAASAATMNASTSYSLRVVVSGNNIDAYWDGAGSPTVSYASASFQAELPVIGITSFVSGAYNPIVFDDITVTGNTLTTTYQEWSNNEGLIGEHPIIKDGVLYTSLFDNISNDDAIGIYHPQDGTLLHLIDGIGFNMAAAVVLDSNNIIYAWSSQGAIFKYSRYGKQFASNTDPSNIDWEAFTLDSTNNRVIVVNSSGDLSGIDTGDLSTADWTNTSPTYTNNTQNSPVLINGSYIYAIDTNGVLFKLNLSDGTTNGSLDITAVTLDTPYAQLIYDTARDDVYISDETGRTIYSIDVSTSTLAENWSVTLGSAGESVKRGGAYHNDVLYVTLRQTTTPYRSKIYALDVTNSGSTIWTNTTAFDNDAQVSSLVTDGDYVYATTFDYDDASYTKLLVIEATDGALVTTHDLDTGASSSIPVAHNGHLFIGLWNDLGLQSIRVRSGGGTGDFPWKADSNYTGYIGNFMGGSVIGVFAPKMTTPNIQHFYNT